MKILLLSLSTKNKKEVGIEQRMFSLQLQLWCVSLMDFIELGLREKCQSMI